MKSYYLSFAFLLVSVVLTLFVLEYGVRFFLGLGTPVLYANDIYFGYAPIPDQQVKRRFGATVSIDSFGLRGVGDWSNPADFRILFLGDSVTYGGSYIDDSKLFSSRTCAHLNKSFRAKHYCGNGGVNGWGVLNIAGYLRTAKLDDEDFLVITIISGDAERSLTRLSGQPYWAVPPPEPFPALAEIFFSAVDKLRLRYRFATGVAVGLNEEERIQSIDSFLPSLREELVNREISDDHILILHSPALPHFTSGYSSYDQHLLDSLDKLPGRFFALKESIDADWSKLYFDQVHLNKEGHRVVGEFVADKIREVQLTRGVK